MADNLPDNQLEYYRNHPPACLSAFVVEPVSVEEMGFDGHGASGLYPDGLIENLNIIFQLRCSCGGRRFRVVAESGSEGVWTYESLVIGARYFLICQSCRARKLIFDPSLHGYDAEVDRAEGAMEEREPRAANVGGLTGVESIEATCAKCRNNSFEVLARFEYPGDLFDEELFVKREEQFFSWFTVVGKCSRCSAIGTFIDYECA